MQRQWSIEARADFTDKDKNDAITEVVRQAAVMINATIKLLLEADKVIKDGVDVVPQVAAFSEDWFLGHEDIDLIRDTMGEAIKSVPIEETGISQDMLSALREMKADAENKG